MREDWVETELGYISKIYNGNSINAQLKKEKYLNFPSGFNYIATKDLSSDGVINYQNGIKIPINEPKFKIAPNGSVLVCSEGGSAGRKTAYVNEDICFGNKLFAITNEFNLIEGKYVFYYTRYRKFFEDFKNQMNGIIGGVSARKFSLIPFPLSPLPIQRAIVSKIETLFSDLDNGISDLKKAQDQLRIYRQAVLKKAFEGELTKGWRDKQIDLPAAEELLEQIKQERQKHYEQQLDDWKKSIKIWEENGKEAKRPSKPRQLVEIPVISEDELIELPVLPKTMFWKRLGDIVWSVKDGPHYSPKYSESGIPFLSGGNIRPSGVDFKNVKYISLELHGELSKRCKPELNDILYTKGGTTGIARVNTYDFDFNVWVHVAVLKSIDSIVPFYLQHVLNSTHCYKQSQKYTHGVGNQDLGLTRLVLIVLPICSKREQHQIVREIESRLSVCDKVEESIKEGLEKAEALRQSILKKAFEGKLLSQAEIEKCKQEPDYEPASELLKKIKAERK
ncbi:MAG: restriction endonuclease subunit S [Candidatus Omnitrophica bacterium]|nr:restriction endonuclease subunit S [Candidatus Omnitrophota bacterium]